MRAVPHVVTRYEPNGEDEHERDGHVEKRHRSLLYRLGDADIAEDAADGVRPAHLDEAETGREAPSPTDDASGSGVVNEGAVARLMAAEGLGRFRATTGEASPRPR